MASIEDPLNLKGALTDLQQQLGTLLDDLMRLYAVATPDRPEVGDICLHLESLIMEAEAVLACPELLGLQMHERTIH